jgi:cytoskeleton protein RodZ
MPTIGQELKRERGLRGVSLSDISKITKIKLNLLQALEDDRLNILPGEFFIKGMIRAYAKCIGLDEDQALNLYQHSVQQKVQDQAYESKKKDTPILRSRKPNTPLIVAAVVVLAAVSLLIILGFGQKKGPTPAAVTAKPPAVKVAPAPATAGAPADKPEALPQGLALRIVFQQDTWIQVSADGTEVLAQIKKAGEQLSVTCRKEFILSTGNAGGFTYTLGNAPGKPLGRPGDVVRNIRIGLDNYRQYLGAQ